MSLFRFKRTSQPQQAVAVDWSNPITRGLTVANYGNSRINLVDGKSEIAKTSLASGVSAAGVSGQALVNSTARYWKTPVVGSNGSTIFGAGKAQSVASATLYGSYCQDGTNAGYINVIEASNYSVLSLPTYAGRSTPRPSDGTNFNHATVATSTSADAWLNGKKYGTGLGGSYGNLSVAGYVEYTGATAQPRPTNGLLFLAWGRALSDLEIKSLSDNPWQIFQPTNRQFFVSSAGAGTVNLAADAAAVAAGGADLLKGVSLVGAALSVASATGGLSHLVPLGASAVGQVSSTGQLSLTINFAATAVSTAVATALMALGKPLAGAAAAQAAGTADLSVVASGSAVSLAAAAVAAASSGATLSLVVNLSAAAVAQATATATLGGGAALAAAAIANAQASAAMAVGKPLAAGAVGQSSSGANLWLDVQLGAQALATAAAGGALSLTVNLSANALGQASAGAALSKTISLTAGGVAVATGTASLMATGPIVGNAAYVAREPRRRWTLAEQRRRWTARSS